MNECNELELTRISSAFKNGAERVISKKNELNEINVFPVADGDTGSNLASLMAAISDVTTTENDTVVTFFEKNAAAAFEGARGNSGIILSQFFSGLALIKSPHFQDFTQTAVTAADYAYEAIDNPVEGTMLTVIKAWSNALATVYAETAQVKQSLKLAFIQAELALKNTQTQLAVLKKKKVVDSGAKGFVYFLEGFTEQFLAETIDDTNQQAKPEPVVTLEESASHLPTVEPNFRYCTEVLLANTQASIAEIKERLRIFGDSLVVAKTTGKTRVHIHTNQPADVIASLNELGTITQQKADDMLLQFQVKQAPKSTIALVTDSVADIPADLLLQEQIHVLPMSLMLDGVTYIDKLTLDSSRLFEMKADINERPTTSLPSLATIQNLFSFLESHYEKAIFITVAKELSGTFNAVKQFAGKRAKSQFEVAVIDSNQNSAAQGLIVLEVAKLINQQLPFAQIIETTEAIVKQTKIFVSIETIDAMIESGRVSSSVGKVLKKIKLNPIISLNEHGSGAIAGMGFSREKNEQKISKMIKKINQTKNITSYSIVHAGNPEKAQEWARHFSTILGMAPDFVMAISTVVALGAGEGSVAIAITFQERG